MKNNFFAQTRHIKGERLKRFFFIFSVILLIYTFMAAINQRDKRFLGASFVNLEVIMEKTNVKIPRVDITGKPGANAPGEREIHHKTDYAVPTKIREEQR
ncbi:MAG: hypothetical protein RR398_04095 [Clostridia bacterium]